MFVIERQRGINPGLFKQKYPPLRSLHAWLDWLCFCNAMGICIDFVKTEKTKQSLSVYFETINVNREDKNRIRIMEAHIKVGHRLVQTPKNK